MCSHSSPGAGWLKLGDQSTPTQNFHSHSYKSMWVNCRIGWDGAGFGNPYLSQLICYKVFTALTILIELKCLWLFCIRLKVQNVSGSTFPKLTLYVNICFPWPVLFAASQRFLWLTVRLTLLWSFLVWEQCFYGPKLPDLQESLQQISTYGGLVGRRVDGWPTHRLKWFRNMTKKKNRVSISSAQYIAFVLRFFRLHKLGTVYKPNHIF